MGGVGGTGRSYGMNKSRGGRHSLGNIVDVTVTVLYGDRQWLY